MNNNVAPVLIETAMHYWTRPGDHQKVTDGAPAYVESVQRLVEAGLLKVVEDKDQRYRATDGLCVYIDALCNVPFPVLDWVMPK